MEPIKLGFTFSMYGEEVDVETMRRAINKAIDELEAESKRYDMSILWNTFQLDVNQEVATFDPKYSLHTLKATALAKQN